MEKKLKEANTKVPKCILPRRMEIDGIYGFFYEEPDADYEFEGEFHNFWEAVFVIKGSIRVTAGSDIFVLEKGQAIVHPPMEFHALRSMEKNTAYFIVSFTGIMPFENRITGSADTDKILEIYRRGLATFEFHGESIWVRNVKNDIEAAYVVKCVESIIMNMFVSGSKENVYRKTEKNYSLIVTMLHTHIHKKLTIGELAELCSMSESNVKKVFKKYSGVSVMHYFNVLKISRAKQLLCEGCNVSDTAEKLGFSDSNYFSTVFKRITGVSPLEYKKS